MENDDKLVKEWLESAFDKMNEKRESFIAECVEMFRQKNADYGDTFREYAFDTTMLDHLRAKINRAINIKLKEEFNFESYLDNMQDIAIYSALIYIVGNENNSGEMK